MIHTVGPVWHGRDHHEDALLANCHRRSLELAAEHGLRRVAFPAVSTGAYGFPLARAAEVAVQAVRAFLAGHALPEQVVFACFSEEARRAFAAAVAREHRVESRA